MAYQKYTLPELLDRFDLKYSGDTERGKMDCPFCGAKKKLNLKLEDDTWHCVKCGNGGGVFHFFSLYKLGSELPKKAPKEQRDKVKEDLVKFMEGESKTPSRPKSKPTQAKREPVPVAEDDKLNAVYSAMAELPFLRLIPSHRNHLLNRGLSNEIIDRNGYCSLSLNCQIEDQFREMYQRVMASENLPTKLRHMNAGCVMLGIKIAFTLAEKGLDVKNVPGFFKFGVYWCFWVTEGILIPTRNIRGQIVIWQIRKEKLRNKDDLRYITASNALLPGHVTAAVSRTHFPIGNPTLSPKVPFLITEGPLKADVASFLYGKPIFFAAIPGITTTNDLYSNVSTFLAAGVREGFNALDMDKITNPNVRKGSQKLVDELSKRNFLLKDMYWGAPYATRCCIALTVLAKTNNIPVPPSPSNSVYDRLNAVSYALDCAGIPFPFRDSHNSKLYWDKETKGIDDYCFSLKK